MSRNLDVESLGVYSYWGSTLLALPILDLVVQRSGCLTSGGYNSRGSTFLGLPILDLVVQNSGCPESWCLHFLGVYTSRATYFGCGCPDFWLSKLWGSTILGGSTFLALPILDLVVQTSGGL